MEISFSHIIYFLKSVKNLINTHIFYAFLIIFVKTFWQFTCGVISAGATFWWMINCHIPFAIRAP